MKIILNGSRVEVEAGPLTYERIVTLAGRDPRRVFSVTYHWQGEGDAERNGSLRRGQQVEPADGMIFSVADTSIA